MLVEGIDTMGSGRTRPTRLAPTPREGCESSASARTKSAFSAVAASPATLSPRAPTAPNSAAHADIRSLSRVRSPRRWPDRQLPSRASAAGAMAVCVGPSPKQLSATTRSTTGPDSILHGPDRGFTSFVNLDRVTPSFPFPPFARVRPSWRAVKSPWTTPEMSSAATHPRLRARLPRRPRRVMSPIPPVRVGVPAQERSITAERYLAAAVPSGCFPTSSASSESTRSRLLLHEVGFFPSNPRAESAPTNRRTHDALVLATLASAAAALTLHGPPLAITLSAAPRHASSPPMNSHISSEAAAFGRSHTAVGVIASAPGSPGCSPSGRRSHATPASGCFTNFDLAAGSDKIAPSVPAPA